MREIKFRAWDIQTKAMITNSTRTISMCGGFDNDNPIFKLMQYAGLKDKNGVEIYEGDIVKTKNSRYKVIFDKCCFWGVGELGKCPIYQIFHYVLDDEKFEVIGNIYENKELLDV